VCVRIGGDVAVAVFVTNVGVQVRPVAVRAKTREGDEHHDDAYTDHKKDSQSAKYPPEGIRFLAWWRGRRGWCPWWRRWRRRRCRSRSRTDNRRLWTTDLCRWRLREFRPPNKSSGKDRRTWGYKWGSASSCRESHFYRIDRITHDSHVNPVKAVGKIIGKVTRAQALIGFL